MSQPAKLDAAGERILLAEDRATQALRGRFALEAPGFEVAVCDSGMARLQYVKCEYPIRSCWT